MKTAPAKPGRVADTFVVLQVDHVAFDAVRDLLEHLRQGRVDVDVARDLTAVSYTHLTLPTKA